MYKPNNPNLFPTVIKIVNNMKLSNNNIKPKLENVKLVDCMRQASNLQRLFCKSEFVCSKFTYLVKKSIFML